MIKEFIYNKEDNTFTGAHNFFHTHDVVEMWLTNKDCVIVNLINVDIHEYLDIYNIDLYYRALNELMFDLMNEENDKHIKTIDQNLKLIIHYNEMNNENKNNKDVENILITETLPNENPNINDTLELVYAPLTPTNTLNLEDSKKK